ncbi:MAG: hypothetical protein SOY64_08950 [Pyramidobacter sp.]|nr:hypothetical protein [Pyramidobacter sp.]
MAAHLASTFIGFVSAGRKNPPLQRLPRRAGLSSVILKIRAFFVMIPLSRASLSLNGIKNLKDNDSCY